MRFSLNFIREFLKVETSAEELASLLTMVGLEVEHFEKCADDWVFDVEVTSNRYDWLSMLGIGREVASCLGVPLEVKYPPIVKKPGFDEKKILIQDTKDCPFYVGRVLRDVTIKESPAWLRERITHCGLNAVNNVVDITNYCMLKWGNPLHAFDKDKLEGNIHIRRAKAGELFVGIDAKERILKDTNLVIADDKKVVALAGVMGAKNTEVDSGTKNIFLEAAVFSPITTRRSRRLLGIESESSYRFERRVFADYLECASSEASNLIEQLAQGTFSGYVQAGKIPDCPKRTIMLRLSHLNAYLGDNFPKNKVKTILGNLGFQIKATRGDTMRVLVPRFRLDIESQVDVYEEFIRVYGYDKIKATVPFLHTQGSTQTMFEFKNELKKFLTTLGLKEIITYSIDAQSKLTALGEENAIRLLNPLREQENVLRPTLLSGFLDSTRYNLNRNQENLRFFEVAHIYVKYKDNFREIPYVCLGLAGKNADFFSLKGIIEEILRYVNIGTFRFKEESVKNFTNALKMVVGDTEIGFLGKLDRKAKNLFDLKDDVFFAQLDVGLLKTHKRAKQYLAFSAYPALFRDISIALKKGIKFEHIERIIRREGRFIADLRIIDTYHGKDIPCDYRAFTLRIFYQSPQKTLSSGEVDASHNTIREYLARTEGVLLR
jgi:phenylalanyl-tRNA synthetase beta chain